MKHLLLLEKNVLKQNKTKQNKTKQNKTNNFLIALFLILGVQNFSAAQTTRTWNIPAGVTSGIDQTYIGTTSGDCSIRSGNQTMFSFSTLPGFGDPAIGIYTNRWMWATTSDKHLYSIGNSSSINFKFTDSLPMNDNGSTAMTIKRTGVSIGRSNPTATLDLYKLSENAADRNVMLKLTNGFAPGTLNEPTLTFDNGTTSTTYGGEGWTIGAQVAGSSYLRIGRYTGNPAVHSEYLRINQNGKVIIGNPSGINTSLNFNLFVPVGIRTEAIQVDLKSAWSDFVFDKGYRLAPLAEV